MRFFYIIFLFMVMLFTGSSFAGEIRRIELSDGGVIYGEIVALSDGVYTVKSKSLGTLNLDESKIRAIRFRDSSESTADTSIPGQTSDKGRVQLFQQLMMADPETMNMILSLEKDPEFQAVMKDPEIMKAVNAGNIEALISNPKFMKLLRSPVVQDIGKKVGR